MAPLLLVRPSGDFGTFRCKGNYILRDLTRPEKQVVPPGDPIAIPFEAMTRNVGSWHKTDLIFAEMNVRRWGKSGVGLFIRSGELIFLPSAIAD
jgi:hypothetical protein